jgi:hypothetical protein
MNMFQKTLLATAAALSFGLAHAADNSLTFQNVTFATTVVDSDTLELHITNALNANGDWAGIQFLQAFEIKGVGDITSGSLAGWTYSPDGLNANGCMGGIDHGACFTKTPPLALSNDMTFSVDLFGTNLNLFTPTLKVQFLSADGTKQGSLLSMPIPAVPEPETYALMLAGLGIMGFVARRRRQQR